MANAFYSPAPTQAGAVAPQMQTMPSAPSYQFADSPAVAREVATVQSQILIAKRFPRDEQYSLQKIAQACSREKLANSAFYSFSRGGTDVKGGSIRIYEAVANAWGNIKYGFEETDNEDSVSTVRAYAYDMEANTQAERVFKVPHIRHTKEKDYPLTDPRDIYEAIANQSARRVRACLAEVIPSDVVEYALDLCDKTRKASVNITPETLDKLCEAFATFHVSRMQIEAYIQRNLTAITTDQYLKLKDVYASIRDGIGKVETYFRSEAEIKAEKGETTHATAQPTTAQPAPKAEPVASPAPVKMEEEDVGEFNF